MRNLWDNVHDMFDTNYGDLPDIEVQNLSPEGVARIWSYLRSLATGYIGEASFWYLGAQHETPINGVENAAALVASRVASPFHTLLHGITLSGRTLPNLGVFVFQDSVVFDYRPGAAWGPSEVQGLFTLLRQIQTLDPEVVISFPDTYNPDWKARFKAALNFQ